MADGSGGFLRLTKGGQASTDADRVFAESVHERFCRLRSTAVSGPLDALRQAFVDHTLEFSLHVASKDVAGVAFAKIMLDKPPSPDAKARKATAERRNVAAAAAAAARTTPSAKAGDTTRPPPKK
jgi:hypothetical protein